MPLAVVTGATSPIGQAIALSLAQRGFDLLLHGHTGQADLQFDLATPFGQDAFCSAVKARASCIDVLVHNAASYRESTLRALTREEWRATMALNVEAPVFITKALLPLLEAATSPCIVHVTDAMSERVRPKHFAYGASKALLTQITYALAVELGPRIRVNAVAPGLVTHSPDAADDRAGPIVAKIPLGRAANADEIAKAVTYLACDATYATGEILVVDGGRRLV